MESTNGVSELMINLEQSDDSMRIRATQFYKV